MGRARHVPRRIACIGALLGIAASLVNCRGRARHSEDRHDADTLKPIASVLALPSATADAGPKTPERNCTPYKSTPFSLRFPLDDKRAVAGVGIDACGDVVVAGSFRGSIDFGGGPLESAGSEDIFVVRFGGAGNHVSSFRYGDKERQSARAMTVDEDGNVYIAGTMEGTLDFGGKAITRPDKAAAAIFLARVGRDGKGTMARVFADGGKGAVPVAIAADRSGNVAIAGVFVNSLDMGGGPLTSPLGGSFIARYNQYGAHTWSRGLVSEKYPRAVRVEDISFDAAGGAIVAGSFEASMDVGGQRIASYGRSDAFVLRYQPSGALHWAKHFGDGEPNSGEQARIDSDGNLILLQEHERRLNAKKTLVAALSKFRMDDKKLYDKAFGNGSPVENAAFALAPSGELVLAADVTENVSFGGTLVQVPRNGRKLAVSRFDLAGKNLSTVAFGEDPPFTRAVAVDPLTGDALVTGAVDVHPEPGKKLGPGKKRYNLFLLRVPK